MSSVAKTPKKLTVNNSQFLLYQDESGMAKLDVRFDGDDVWLTQEQIATRRNFRQVQLVRNSYELPLTEKAMRQSTTA